MPNYSRLEVIGHLTRDPVSKAVGEYKLAEWGIAWNRKVKGESIASFLDCKCWGKLGETCCTYLRKGQPTHLAGTLEQEHWNDRDTGQKRSKFVLNVERMTLLGDGDGPRERQETTAAWPDAGADDGPAGVPF